MNYPNVNETESMNVCGTSNLAKNFRNFWNIQALFLTVMLLFSHYAFAGNYSGDPSPSPNLQCPDGFIPLAASFHSTNNSGSVSGLFPFAGTDATFEYSLIGANPGSYPQWNYGVGSKNNNALAPDGDYINVQVRNSGFPDGDRARYRFVFSSEVYGLEFKWGGMDHSDRITVVAANGSTSAPVTLENINIPNNVLTWVGSNSLISDANGANAPSNALKVSFSEPVTEFTIEAAKENGNHNNVTMQLYELRYCVPANSTHAKNDMNQTVIDIPVSGQVLTNDFDLEGHGQSVSLIAAPLASEGTLTLSASGEYTFSPASGFHGVARFRYQACDDASSTACDEAEVAIVVLPAPSTANNDLIAFNDNMKFPATGVDGQVLTNDHDWDGGTLSVSALMVDTDGNGTVDTPASIGTAIMVGGRSQNGESTSNAGQLTLQADGSLSFIPQNDFDGKVVARYTTTNPMGQTDEADITLIGNGQSGNDTHSLDDIQITDKNIAISGNLLLNDWDPQEDPQTVDAFSYDSNGDGHADAQGSIGVATQVGGIAANGSTVAHAGSITLAADGNYTFTPATGFVGNVYLPYQASDAPGANSAATLYISVLNAIRDTGDGHQDYGTAIHRGFTDANNDNIPDGSHDIWLGSAINAETMNLHSPDASTDQYDDGVTLVEDGLNHSLDIVVNSNTQQTVYYGVWVDYDDDQVYDDFISGQQTANGSATINVILGESAIEASLNGTPLNFRVRVDDTPFAQGDYSGIRTNGEVEDYYFSSLQPLPVEMVYFRGQEADCHLELQWGTASEEQNSHFEVQRSTDGRHFEQVGIVEGNGNSAEAIDYRFLDRTAPKGRSYYRLKQVDFDGGYEYSDVVLLEKECGTASIMEMKAYPNPTSQQLTLDLGLDATTGGYEIRVTNTAGQVVLQERMELKGGRGIQLDLGALPSAFYTVTCLAADGKSFNAQVFKR